jgi:hypothetical protein
VNNGNIEANTPKKFERLSDREEMIAYITYFRLNLYNNGLPCGPKAIQEKLRDEEITPIPSTATIARALKKQCLTNGRTGHYEEDYLTEEANRQETY